jgi:hypothetical protein
LLDHESDSGGGLLAGTGKAISKRLPDRTLRAGIAPRVHGKRNSQVIDNCGLPRNLIWTTRRSRCQNRAQRAAYDAISVRESTSQMPRSPMRTHRNSYTGYSIGCAGVWGVILLLARRRLDSQTWNTLRLVCSGWWMGWTSATIARIGYPPPKQLTPAGEKRLRIISIVLIALGLTSTVRMFAVRKRPPGSTPGA